MVFEETGKNESIYTTPRKIRAKESDNDKMSLDLDSISFSPVN